jgi:hypothetical protein
MPVSTYGCWVCRSTALDVGPGSCRCSSVSVDPPCRSLQCRSAGTLMHTLLTYGWHLAQNRQSAARLLLAMSPQCVNLVRACTLSQVGELAGKHPAWLQPRWPQHVRIWREFLSAALAGDGRVAAAGAPARIADSGGRRARNRRITAGLLQHGSCEAALPRAVSERLCGLRSRRLRFVEGLTDSFQINSLE